MMQPRIDNETGSALYVSVFASFVLMGLTWALLAEVTTSSREHATSRDRMERLSVAESGLEMVLLDLNSGGAGNLGTAEELQVFGKGAFWATSTHNEDGTLTVISRGILRGRTRAIEAVVEPPPNVFHHAVFAGNSSEDPSYVMDFGGVAGEADEINGNVYSGQDVNVWGNAAMNGAITTAGVITGAEGTEGTTRPIPDIAGMNYAVNNDVDVKKQFDEFASYRRDNAGGKAWQLPASNPAHFLRKNPSDRGTENASTVKDDFYLEDPYEPVRVDPNQNGKDAYHITLNGAPGLQVLRQVFYIDGNLWIHNKKTYSFRLKADQGASLAVTFVVKGSIYISDNLFYNNKIKDGVAFIAMKDENVADSGNIYFGDPRFGTLTTMSAFLYAEDSFYDNNLSATGSKEVTLNGTMSAGNHVSINRTYRGRHSKLTVNFDDRLKNGDLDLPGIPQAQDALSYVVVMWKETSPYK